MSEEISKSFIEELQSLDESTKRRVLIVSTIVVMLLVVYLWLGYFNGLVAGTTQDSTMADAGQQGNAVGGSVAAPDFTQRLKNGAATIVTDFMNFPHWLISVFQGPRQYNIQPSQ